MPKRYDLDKFSDSRNLQKSKALELIMRDVIDGMEELANMSGFSPKANECFEILSIDSPDDSPKDYTDTPPAVEEQNDTVVVPLKRKKQAAA